MSRSNAQRTSACRAELFDRRAREQRRDRAARIGPALFVYERVIGDMLERLSEVKRDFRSALVIGAPDPSAIEAVCSRAAEVEVLEPGSHLAVASGAVHEREDQAQFPERRFDLCVALGTLDTLDDLPGVLRRIRSWLQPDSLLIGVIAGADTLPRLRAAMREADSASGGASPHVHPRVEASALGHLLSAAGFAMPVVDLDRVRVSYPSLARLVGDLRAMAATNILHARPRFVTRSAWSVASAHFAAAGGDGRTVETFELLHFAAWTPTLG